VELEQGTTEATASEAAIPAAVEAPAPADPAAFYADDKPAQADEDGAEMAQEGEGDGDEQVEPVAPPTSWPKDQAEKFATLPRETQEFITKRENERDVFLNQKAMEAARTREAVETEALQALSTVMQNHRQQLQAFEQFVVPEQPDLRLLNSADPAHRDLYFQQEAAYRASVAQRERLTQQLEQVRQHEAAIAQQQAQAELQAEHQLLTEKLGQEWSEPSSRAKLLSELGPIAAELGYPQELIAQARAADIIAMRQVREWKAKAEKLDGLNKAKMVPVRAAKAIPPTARPGAPVSQRGPVSIEAQLYPNDVPRN